MGTLVSKYTQEFVVLKIFEEVRLMRRSGVLDESQKMVRPLTSGAEIQRNPTAGAFHLV